MRRAAPRGRRTPVPAGPILALLLALPVPIQAQRAAAVVQPDSATVGDVVRVAVRVVPETPGTPVDFPAELELPEDVETAGPVEVSRDSVAPFGVTAVYPVTAWRPGTVALGAVPVRVAGGAPVEVPLPALRVVSVLPADTAGIEARPPRDVVGAARLWWPLLLGMLAALAAAALAWWLWRRRQAARHGEAAPDVAARDPRVEAFEALDAVARMPLDGADAIKFFHARLTVALRRYAAAVDPAWGAELTTTELGARARLDPGAAPLLALLARADLVKFARRPATAAAARAELERARAWVAAWPAPEAVAGAAPGAARERVA